MYAQQDSWLRSNHHLYFTDGIVGGTAAKALVAHGFGPSDLHLKKDGNRAAVCTSAATKQLLTIYYEAGHVQPGLYVNAFATEHHPASEVRHHDASFLQFMVGIDDKVQHSQEQGWNRALHSCLDRALGWSTCRRRKGRPMSILQVVVDLDAAQKAITSVRECGLLGHGNAQAFKDCKEDWADEAGNDLDVMRQTLPRKARSWRMAVFFEDIFADPPSQLELVGLWTLGRHWWIWSWMGTKCARFSTCTPFSDGCPGAGDLRWYDLGLLFSQLKDEPLQPTCFAKGTTVGRRIDFVFVNSPAVLFVKNFYVDVNTPIPTHRPLIFTISVDLFLIKSLASPCHLRTIICLSPLSTFLILFILCSNGTLTPFLQTLTLLTVAGICGLSTTLHY